MHWFLKMFRWYRKWHGGRWYRIKDRITRWTEWYTEDNLPVFNPYHKQVIETESYSE
jgi:hypothetical protein